jgi:simple sugar transport system ATP-binding protein
MRRALGAFADRLIHEHEVKTPSRRTRVRQLSGGNQQKLMIGRELAGAPAVIIASNPTRGVDVGATEAIHALLRAHRDHGAAVLLMSEDLDELRLLSDRIAVISRGRLVDTLPVGEATNERLGMLMGGVAPERADPLVAVASMDQAAALDG